MFPPSQFHKVQRLFLPISGVLILVFVALLLAVGSSHSTSDDSHRVVQAEDILDRIKAGDNLDGVILEGDLNLSELTLGTIHFNNTIFLGPVKFENTNFTGNVWFQEANFSGIADFSKARFSGGNADFYGAEFSGGNADFSYAVFSGGDATFTLVKFSGGIADFSYAVFSGGNALFGIAEFLGSNAKFFKAEFSGSGVSFRNAKFSCGDTDFSSAMFSDGDALFGNAVFSGGDAKFSRTEFSGGDANFSNVEYSGGNVDFSNAKFSGGNADFENSAFGNANQNESFTISFNYVQFDRDAYFENSTFHPNIKLDLTRSSYKRMFLPWSSINQKQASASDDDAYLALMRNYMNLGWFEDANDCYYEYRNKRRINEPICIEKITDTLEWLIYGYGVKPTYTVGWIAFLVLLFGLVFTNDVSFKKYIREEIQVVSEDQSTKDQKAVEIKTILREEERINYIVDPLLLSLTTFTSGLTAFLYPSIEYKIEKHTRLVILERLLGSVFLALLITAISKTWLIR